MSDQNPSEESAKVDNLTANLENASIGEEEADNSKHNHCKKI